MKLVTVSELLNEMEILEGNGMTWKFIIYLTKMTLPIFIFAYIFLRLLI